MTLAPMGGGAPAAALVVAAAALPSSPHIGVRAARGIRSAARSPLKRGLMWLVSPRSLPAAAPAPASVCAASSGGWGLLAPSGGCAAAAPPPRPPLSVGGGGCGFHVSAAAGAKKTAPCGAVLEETQYMVLALLDGGLLALPLGDAERAGQSAYAARRVQGVAVAKGQHRNILTR